ncbi:MAG: flavodoxin family protein [Tepidibacter sp.]|jgi:multimeric flavodoxin WrbA|uniref:flavodoxin family protein n=1 Tax=Tepidibacter sp. TaxID=2529387 RepID=UPI0025D75FCD|nr:flavodoxin family protein [Tepidibacter sp.]MCT4507414.1 flavodoxin family protein [Tepidibacter sp.]
MFKKWIAIVGSARNGKNTELITDYIIKALKQKEIYVEKYILGAENISTCSGCEYCIKTGECNINDGVSKIIENMKSADGYILASPSYNYNMTAQMKALLDRTFCLNDYSDGKWKSRLSSNKKAIVVGTCKGKSKECMGYTVEGMKKGMLELDINVVDEIEYYNTKYMPVEMNEGIEERILDRIKNNRKI